jgi:hypothetical protein
VLVSAAVIQAMFPRPMALDCARERLRCSKCGAKKAEFEIFYKPGRG